MKFARLFGGCVLILALLVSVPGARGQATAVVDVLCGLNNQGESTAGLVLGSDGNFYGTSGSSGGFVAATAFQVTPDGALTILHTFDYPGYNVFTNTDGLEPAAVLAEGSDGAFYGTASGGGTTGSGTVFKLTVQGNFTLLYSFSGFDGSKPTGALLPMPDGNFYGTTSGGGTNGYGTVFKITPTGVLTTIYNFDKPTGATPYAGLTPGPDGAFYGTTYAGGANNSGTVYKLTPDGVLTSLYSFSAVSPVYYPDSGPGTNSDGASPSGVALCLANDGNFYGTTLAGGEGGGSIYRISPQGAFTVLTLFYFSYDGGDLSDAGPNGVIQGRDGNFYGTGSGGYGGGGVIFQLTPDGAYTNLYSFSRDAGGNSPGGYPSGPLALGRDGSFYGVTFYRVFKMTVEPLITSAASASTYVNYPFSFQVTATDGANSYGASNLPPGLTIDASTGLISGTPTVLGDYQVTLTASNGTATGTGTLDLNIIPAPPAPVITSAIGASGQLGVSFKYQISATNDPTSFGASGLPAGLVVDPATGLVTGAPTVYGTFYVTLMASNVTGTGTATLTLTVAGGPPLPAPVIVSATYASADTTRDFTYQIVATNTPASYGATNLPDGLTINQQSGLISGRPAFAGTYGVTLSATNAGGTGTATLTLSVTFSAPPAITSPNTATATVGVPFTFQIVASTAPVTFNAFNLPPGLTVNQSTGVISGTPTTAGTPTITIYATNSAGQATSTLTLTIYLAAPMITNAGSASGAVGQAFTYKIVATNNPTGYDATGLPAGLTINHQTGTITGTPTTTGTFGVAISASNAGGITTAMLTLTIGTHPAITSAGNATARVGEPFTYRITATNQPTRFGLNGSLPPGLSCDKTTGVISGTPTAAGMFKVGVVAYNGAGVSPGFDLVLTVISTPATVTVVTGGDGMAQAGVEKGKLIVHRTGGTNAPLTVFYKAKGSAVAGTDYKTLAGSVTIPAGASQAKIKVKPFDGSTATDARVVKVKLKADANGTYTLGTARLAKVVINPGD